MTKSKNSSTEKLIKLVEKLESGGAKNLHKYISTTDNYRQVKRYKSGIFALDCALGGGIPLGHKILFYGKKSSGKSTTVMKYIAPMTQDGLVVVWIDTEGVCNISNGQLQGESFSMWAEINGVNIKNLVVYSPQTIESAVDFMIEMIKSKAVDVFVIDSLAMFEPEAEKESSAYKDFQALQARAIGKMWRKIISEQVDAVSSGKIITMIMTNQVRYKLGVMYGNPETRPGGVSTEFISTIEVELSNRGYDEVGKKDRESKILIIPKWLDISFITRKNKTYPTGIYGEYKIIQREFGNFRAGDIYDYEVVLHYLVNSGMIKESESGGLLFAGKEYKNGNQIIDFWMSDKEGYIAFKNQLVDLVVGNKLRDNSNDNDDSSGDNGFGSDGDSSK